MVRKKFRTVLLRTVCLRGTKLRYGVFLEEFSTEKNSVPYRSNPLLVILLFCGIVSSVSEEAGCSDQRNVRSIELNLKS